MDSNSHFIDWGRFCNITEGPVKRSLCGSLYDVEERIQAADTQKVKCVVLSVGVNDTDVKSAEEVFQQLKTVIDLIRTKHQQPKIR